MTLATGERKPPWFKAPFPAGERFGHIKDLLREHHRLPTYTELVRLFDMKSKGSVHTYIKKFFDSGLIRKSDHGFSIRNAKKSKRRKKRLKRLWQNRR